MARGSPARKRPPFLVDSDHVRRARVPARHEHIARGASGGSLASCFRRALCIPPPLRYCLAISWRRQLFSRILDLQIPRDQQFPRGKILEINNFLEARILKMYHVFPPFTISYRGFCAAQDFLDGILVHTLKLRVGTLACRFDV